jgi:DNA-binding transcriptional regulator YhcF (GntR family)
VETVSRAFSQLKRRGLIELSQAWIVTLKDREGLRQVVEH